MLQCFAVEAVGIGIAIWSGTQVLWNSGSLESFHFS